MIYPENINKDLLLTENQNILLELFSPQRLDL